MSGFFVFFEKSRCSRKAFYALPHLLVILTPKRKDLSKLQFPLELLSLKDPSVPRDDKAGFVCY